MLTLNNKDKLKRVSYKIYDTYYTNYLTTYFCIIISWMTSKMLKTLTWEHFIQHLHWSLSYS